MSTLLGTATSPVVMAEDAILEEVIVTARKRQESLQETPIAVTALGAEALREAGVRNLADLNSIAPNIEVQSANGNAPLANIYIRGIGQRNSGPNIDSGVGIYIDDVYVGRPDGALLDLNDIASVQVLRGPQGTLFGKNTTGGALVFTTNRPQDEFQGSIEARVGNYGRMDGSAMINIPLGEDFATRLSVNSVNRDGYIENQFDGDDYVDEKRVNAIWQLRWNASDTVTLDLNANYADTDQKARPQRCVPVDGVTGWQAALFDTLQVTPSTGRTYDDFCQDAADLGDDRKVISDLGGGYEAENKGLSFTAEWEINDNMSFKSVSAWRYTKAAQDDELDHTGLPWLHRTQLVHPQSSHRETDQYTQEFELSGSAADDRLQYVAGFFYFDEQTDGNIATNFLGPFDPGIGGLFMLNSTSTLLEAKNKAFAAFSQVEWSFNDNWRTTLGIRYTDEERELSRQRYALEPATLDQNGGAVNAAFTGAWSVDRSVFEYNPNFNFAETDYTQEDVGADDTSFMGSLQYLITDWSWVDTGSIYLTYSEGFLSGGLSEAPSGELETFEPEEVANYELGIKLDLLDRRLRLNAAMFYADYTNRQLTTLVINTTTNSPAGATINAAKSTISGIEIETIWLATENLELFFNATFNDGDIDEFEDVQLLYAEAGDPISDGCDRINLALVLVDECNVDRSNENLPRLPEETYFLAAQYTFNTGIGAIIPRLQASLKKNVDYCFDSTSCVTELWLEDEQFDVSGRVTWISNDGKWIGSLYGTNLTDEDYVVGGTALLESAGVGGYAANAPRMYGAELKWSF
ncbi:TonB-dependent receptor [Candidatus Litorirhabdus singularis]|uniref:TonB-dependent receptor n=1 Tax=Candidatus Litorirhabdus singularis TaxID=2518993 RepID=UPI0024329A71|nr:TonB-dependent receptor [Candidatus Litorirhabdus singularis]